MIRVKHIDRVINSLRIKAIDNISNRATIDEIGAVIKKRILESNHKGIQANGTPFTKYSKRWAKRREDRGLRTKPVEHIFENKMLKSIRTTSTMQHKGKMIFGLGQRKKALLTQRIPGRIFFAVNNQDRKNAKKVMLERLKRGL